MIIWMEVTKDEYELPIFIADNLDELAKKSGTSSNCISSTISHFNKGTLKKSKFKKVVIDDE